MVKCPHAASGCDYPASECAGHCTSKQQPEALRLADTLENDLEGYDGMSIPRTCQDIADKAAAEQRRLHAENSDFRATIDYLTRENAEQIGEIVALKEQRDELLEALHLALEYWAHREQRYKNRSPVWVQKSREAIAKAGGAA